MFSQFPCFSSISKMEATRIFSASQLVWLKKRQSTVVLMCVWGNHCRRFSEPKFRVLWPYTVTQESPRTAFTLRSEGHSHGLCPKGIWEHLSSGRNTIFSFLVLLVYDFFHLQWEGPGKSTKRRRSESASSPLILRTPAAAPQTLFTCVL